MNRIALRVIFIAALLWIAALTQRGLPLAVDEVEFFRATKWVGEGQLPFRDFWEHHLPLQWIAFAPVARLIANGPGVEAIVAMRWAQMALWVAIFVLLLRIARRSGVDAFGALVLLLVSASFVRKAIEYRVDVLGNLAYIGAIALVLFDATKKRWVAFGALMSLAVLANMRLAPLVIITALLAWWRLNRRGASWTIAGVVPVAGVFVGWLFATGAWDAFVDGVFHYNQTSARLLEVDTFFDALLTPVWTIDIAGIVFLIAGVVGVAMVLRKPGPLQFLAILAIASVGTIALMEVQYDYHFQNAYLLMLPLAAFALARVRLVPVVAAGALCVFLIQALPSFGEAMEYQDAVMTTADRLTTPEEKVFDGAGFALRRPPAYRYWFLTTGVRFMAARGLLEPYAMSPPPAAIIYDYRAALYLRDFPRVAQYATTHYVPVYRNLWVPGMTAIGGRVRWSAPRAGVYELYASDVLLGHPWLTKPLEYAAVDGPLATRYAIPLAKLPLTPVAVSVDGVVQHTHTLTLRAGSQVEVLPARRTGILLVPRGIGTLCIAPAAERVF